MTRLDRMWLLFSTTLLLLVSVVSSGAPASSTDTGPTRAFRDPRRMVMPPVRSDGDSALVPGRSVRGLIVVPAFVNGSDTLSS